MLLLNSTIAEMRNLLEGLNSIFVLTVERITGIKDKLIKIIQSEEQKERGERDERSLRDPQVRTNYIIINIVKFLE